ncbi:MAG: hypothetical protein QOF16_841 [Actinomycetota bacterium]|nr:hypothetical protein [Actinomycetota bacterium]
MRSLSRRVALVGVLALISTMLAAPLAHAASTTYQVQIGQGFGVGPNCDPASGDGCTFAESMRFFPQALTVHKGDVLHFTSDGFHTATALPKNVGADDWIDANATTQTQPFSLFSADPDEPVTPTQLDFNPAVALPSSFTCGTPDTGPCPYDGSAPLNSGVPLGGSLDFSVTVNANPGDFFYVICLVHHHMRMKVNVVPDSQAGTTQADIDSAKNAQVGQDIDDASALNNKLAAKQSSHSIGGGHKVWDVFNGFDTNGFSLYSQYPSTLKIHKGDKVRWHFGQLVSETHSTVFPLKQANQWANSVGNPVYCDPDRSATSDGPQPGAPGDPNAPPPFCPGGPAQIELPEPNGVAYGTGNGKVTSPKDVESGPLEGPQGLTQASYQLTFPVPGVYSYGCGIHGGLMAGKIVVKS